MNVSPTHGKMIIKKATIILLALIITLMCMILPKGPATQKVEAADKKTSIGLAEFGLKAYNDGWRYNYASYGQLNSNGVRMSDCSGLIYAYLCWDSAAASASASYTPVPNYNWPRGAQSQFNACSETGPLSTLPRTHGILLFFPNCDHVGIYTGNGNAVDNSDYGVNMVYRKVEGRGWVSWGKLNGISYPTNGWYTFNGKPYYYVNGQYVVSTTLTIDKVKYTFSASGIPSPLPTNVNPGSGIINPDGTQTDNCSVTYYTTTDVNVRYNMNTSSTILKTVAKGTKVTVTNKDNANWYKVKLADGTVGYMAADYLTKTNPASAAASTAVPMFRAKVTTTSYLRKTASSTGTKIVSVASGAKVSVTKENGSFYYVTTAGGQKGFLPKASLAKISSVTGKTTASTTLRKSASTSGTAVKSLPAGTKVLIVASYTSGASKGWSKVTCTSGAQGFIKTSLIKKDGSSLDDSSSNTVNIPATITGDGVRLRSEPNTNCSTLAYLYSNTSVTIIEKTNSDWYKIKTSSGQIGYVSTLYIRENAVDTSRYTAAQSTRVTMVRVKLTADTKLRSLATKNYGKVIKTIPKGSLVVVTKKNGSWYYITTMAGSVGFVPSSACSAVTTVKCTTIANVNMRSAASSTASIKMTVNKLTTLTVVYTGTPGWLKVVDISGKTGWIDSRYCKVNLAGTVTADDVRLREKPSTSSKILKELSKGTKVKIILLYNKDWYKVELSNGTKGYISTAYVKR